MRQRFTREQRIIVIYAILSLLLVVVIMQLWLLAATMNAFLGGDESVIWPAAAVSLICFGLNAYLLRYLYILDRSKEKSS